MKKLNEIKDVLIFILLSIVLFGGCAHTLITIDGGKELGVMVGLFTVYLVLKSVKDLIVVIFK